MATAMPSPAEQQLRRRAVPVPSGAVKRGAVLRCDVHPCAGIQQHLQHGWRGEMAHLRGRLLMRTSRRCSKPACVPSAPDCATAGSQAGRQALIPPARLHALRLALRRSSVQQQLPALLAGRRRIGVAALCQPIAQSRRVTCAVGSKRRHGATALRPSRRCRGRRCQAAACRAFLPSMHPSRTGSSALHWDSALERTSPGHCPRVVLRLKLLLHLAKTQPHAC